MIDIGRSIELHISAFMDSVDVKLKHEGGLGYSSISVSQLTLHDVRSTVYITS